MTYSPLVKALERVAREPHGGHGPWNGAAQLYCGAVLQMYQAAPAAWPSGIDLPRTIACLDCPPGAPAGQGGDRAELGRLCKTLRTQTRDFHPDQLSRVAADLVQLLGARLFGYLSHVLDADPQGLDRLDDELFHHEFDRRRHTLVLAHARNPAAEGGLPSEPLRPDLSADGWLAATGKVLPPLVRVAPWIDSGTRPKVLYLRHLLPKADEALGRLAGGGELRLAAMAMDRALCFGMEEIGGNADSNRLVRVIAPAAMPAGWEKTLFDQVRQCSEKRIAVAVMPELSLSPAMEEVARLALRDCTNGYPALLVAGSWHVDNGKGDGRFVNRMTVLGAALPGGRGRVLEHDKFETYISGGRREGNVCGPKGFSYLVTSIGIMVFGICKDWFVLRPEGAGQALEQFRCLAPLLCLAPAFTATAKDLLDLAVPLKETGAVVVVANNCGTVRQWFFEGACCGLERSDDRNRRDVRSFISAPNKWYSLVDGHSGEKVLDGGDGLLVGRAPCANNPGQAGAGVHHNTVFCYLRPRKGGDGR